MIHFLRDYPFLSGLAVIVAGMVFVRRAAVGDEGRLSAAFARGWVRVCGHLLVLLGIALVVIDGFRLVGLFP